MGLNDEEVMGESLLAFSCPKLPLHSPMLYDPVKMHLPVFAAQKSESMSDEECDFEHQQFKEDTSLSDHLNKFQGIIDQMSGMDIKFEDDILGLLLLNYLLESLETFKISITNSSPNGIVSLQMVNGSVINEEMRRKAQGSSSQSKENKGKKGKSKEKDDDRVTTTIGDDLVILRDFESVNLVFDESDFGVLKMDNDGVTKVKSFSGALYFVTFIDDCPRKLWVYVLKTKDQVLVKFKQFQALVERQSDKKVKCIHSDNGGEYCGLFDVYCKQHGIRYEKTPPKTPQLNDLVERMNMTLIERHLWGEALYIAVHVINLSPVVALNTKVPDKIRFGKDVNYNHLRVFGCKAFVHVPKDERSKLNMKTRQCIFIGYGHDEYGYRMYDPVEKKLVRRRDVQFMEDQTIEDIDKVKKSTLEKDNSLSEIDPIWMPVHYLDTVDNNIQNGEQHKYIGDQQLEDGFDIPLNGDVEEEQEMSQYENLGDAPEPPPIQLRRSNRKRQSSTRYTSDEYVTLTDGKEPECY
ncbi:hypothetical protein CR513_10796, partial [Mucuna pruriens]